MSETNIVSGGVLSYASKPEYRDMKLYGFDVNQFGLKPTHETALKELVAFLTEDIKTRIAKGIKGDAYWITLEGFASTTGDDGPNKILSGHRVASVESYVTNALAEAAGGYLGYIKVKKREFHGEKKSDPKDHVHWRAVRVVAHRPEIVPGAPPDAEAPPDLTAYKSDTFSIQLVRAVSGSVPSIPMMTLSADNIVVKIVDTENHVGSLYAYYGVGVSISASIPKLPKIPPLLQQAKDIIASPPVQYTPIGVPFYFKTGGKLMITQFDGDARYSQFPSVTVGIPFLPGYSVSAANPILEFKGYDFLHYGKSTTPKNINLPAAAGTPGLSLGSDTEGTLIWLPKAFSTKSK